MGKQQDWSVTAYVFLFLSLASQIHSTSDETSDLDSIRRVSMPSVRTRTGNVSQQNQKEKDLIQYLPGQPSVNFKQYGGYVTVNETAGRFLYYYFVEAVNANDSTPLVIWFNGGPGCSSLEGALAELGPFRTHSDGKTLFRNPYAWNNEANVLFVEMPVGVGFSYTNTPLDVIKEGQGGDKRTAEENYMFLLNWLERFPEFKERELYIAGQSYAGHYVPQLAQIIVHHNNQTFINLRGILIGNPSLEDIDASYHEYEYMANHAFISRETFENYKKLCKGNQTAECMKLMSHIQGSQGSSYNMYNIYAPSCRNSTLSNKPNENATVMNNDPCTQYYTKAYLNTKEVQKAMHANTTNIPYAWNFCNDELRRSWNKDKYASMVPILQELMGEGVRIWVYSGDMDKNIPVTYTMDIIKKMNLTVASEWFQWFSDGELGGFREIYKGNLTFITVRGAGHAVPADQPIRALTLFTNFLRNSDLPTVNPYLSTETFGVPAEDLNA